MQQLRKIINHLPAIIQKRKNFWWISKFISFSTAFRHHWIWSKLGTAKEAETKLTETIRVPSQGFELEAYMHGPYLEADASHLLFFIEGKV